MSVRLLCRTAFCALAILDATGAVSAEPVSKLVDFNVQVAAAMQHFRQASFYLRTGNTAFGQIELDALAEKWRGVVARFAANPPDPFADDPGFRRDLDAVAARIAAAAPRAASSDSRAAGAALAPIRQRLRDLRARNGVRVFADCIADLNDAMRALWRYRHVPPDFDNAEQLNGYRAGTAVLEYWYRRCDREAPDAVRKNPSFRRLVDGALEGIARLWKAADTRNRLLLINTLRELRSYDGLIYLRFG